MYRATELGILKDKLHYALDGDQLVITGGRLIDGKGRESIEPVTIVIDGEYITNVGPDGQVDIPTGSKVTLIDASGKTIMPGLIDLHLHFTGDSHRDPYRRYIQPIEEVRILRGALDANRILAAGFTTVRVLGHGTPNQAETLKIASNQRLIAAPRIFHAGWSLSQTGGHGNLAIWPYELVEQLRPRSAFVDGVTECRVAVRNNLGNGAHWIKIYTTEGVITSPPHKQGLPNFTHDEIIAITDEAHRRGARVAAHATAPQGVLNAIRGGVDTIEHGAPTPEGGWLEEMASMGRYLIPTLTVFASAAQAEGYPPEVTERLQEWYRGSLAAVTAAKDLGVKIGLGTDDGRSPLAGQNAWELELLVEAGLTPMEAIQAGTQTAAEALGMEDQLGTIEPGKVADIIVVDGDPSKDIRVLRNPDNIIQIIKSGASLA
jgi:imidazolonepropionase-like amidohydrolase